MLRRSIGPDYAGPLLRKDILPSPESSTIDDGALDRILAAVGRSFIPHELNKNSLRAALNEAAEGKEIVDRFRPGSRTRALTKAVVRIRGVADKLAKALKENDDASQLITNAVPQILTTMTELIEYAGVLEQKLSDTNRLVRARYNRIHLEESGWLAWSYLIFLRSFSVERRGSRNAGAPSGPTVRFILAVMSEIDHPPKSETIVRAMTMYSDLRKGRAAVRKSRGHIGKK